VVCLRMRDVEGLLRLGFGLDEFQKGELSKTIGHQRTNKGYYKMLKIY